QEERSKLPQATRDGRGLKRCQSWLVKGAGMPNRSVHGEKTMRQIPKDIREGKAALNAIKAKIDRLDAAFIAAARERAKNHKTSFSFPYYGASHLAELIPGNPHVWDVIILAWQLCLLFCEYT